MSVSFPLAGCTSLLLTICLALLPAARSAAGQSSATPAAAPGTSNAPAPNSADPLLSLSPDAAYEQALAPVAIVHRSVANWSDSETASLAVAIRLAKASCEARPPARYTGADLIGLARLCALGQLWPTVLEASNRFLAVAPAPPPLLALPPGVAPAPQPASLRARALAYRIEGSLNLHDPATALATARLLLSSEPYTPLVQQSTDGLLRYLQLVQTSDALDFAGERLSKILPLLGAAGLQTLYEQAAGAGSKLEHFPPLPSADTLTAHELYAAALITPTLLQLGNNLGAAAGTLATIEAALPAQLPPDELPLIALARRQYALLGSVLPPVTASVSLFSPGETPRVNRQFGAATVLLVFPDWCAQCVRMAREGFMPFLTRHAGENVHLYGLLAQKEPPPVAAVPAPPTARRPRSTAAPATPDTASPAPLPRTPADLLRGTPTLVIASDLPLATFAATDFPLLLVTDHEGRIRFAETAPENALLSGGLVDQVVARVVELWPPPASQP